MAALGDIELVRQHLDADPECIRMRVSDEHFPMVGSGKGGTIYQWVLGWYVSAGQVVKSYRHPEIFNLLMTRSPADEKILNACWLHDQEMVHPKLYVRSGNAELAGTIPHGITSGIAPHVSRISRRFGTRGLRRSRARSGEQDAIARFLFGPQPRWRVPA